MSSLPLSSSALDAAGFADAEELEDELWRNSASTQHMMQLEAASPVSMAQGSTPLLCHGTRTGALAFLRNLFRMDHAEQQWFQAAGILDEISCKVKDPVCIHALSAQQLPATLFAIHVIILKFDGSHLYPSRCPPMLKQLVRTREQEVLAAICWKMKPTLESWASLFCKRALALRGDTVANDLYKRILSLAEVTVLQGSSWQGSLRSSASAHVGLVVQTLQGQALSNVDLSWLLGGKVELPRDLEWTGSVLALQTAEMPPREPLAVEA